MTSSEEELREELIDSQHSTVWQIGIVFMLVPPYLIGNFLFVFVPSVDFLYIAIIICGGWIATIAYWTFYGKSYIMKRWYPELSDWYEKMELSKHIEELREEATKK